LSKGIWQAAGAAEPLPAGTTGTRENLTRFNFSPLAAGRATRDPAVS
jgi:hypothetical protein